MINFREAWQITTDIAAAYIKGGIAGIKIGMAACLRRSDKKKSRKMASAVNKSAVVTNDMLNTMGEKELEIFGEKVFEVADRFDAITKRMNHQMVEDFYEQYKDNVYEDAKTLYKKIDGELDKLEAFVDSYESK